MATRIFSVCAKLAFYDTLRRAAIIICTIAPSCGGRCSDFNSHRNGKSTPAANGRAFCYLAPMMELDFAEIGRPDHRRHSGSRFSGRVLMVGYMNEEAFRRTVETGFATFLSRSRQQALAEGRKLRPSPRGKTDLGRLRSATQCSSRWKRSAPASATKATQSCFFRRLEDGEWKVAEERTYDPAPSTEARREAQARHSQRQPGKRHRRPVPPRRIQHHHQQPLLLSLALTIPKSNAC